MENNRAYRLAEEIIAEALIKKAEKLDLSSLMLSKLPETIGAFENLKSLDISFNILNTLPKELGNLKKLEYLNISSNKFDKTSRMCF